MGGPVLFTAPHGLQLYRGGGDTGERQRVHLRERWSTEIALRLAIATDDVLFGSAAAAPPGAAAAPSPCQNSSSFCVWNCSAAAPNNLKNKDPNYLRNDDLSSNPWHQSLKDFRGHVAAAGIAGLRPLHIDVHGKKNRPTDFDIDVGADSMDALYDGDGGNAVVATFRAALRKEFTTALEGCRVRLKGMAPTIEMQPWLSGLWGTDPSCPITMTTQAVRLGMVSTQLEIPYDMRRALVTDDALLRRLAVAVANVFVAIQSPAVQQALRTTPALSGADASQKRALAGAAATELLRACAVKYRSEGDKQI